MDITIICSNENETRRMLERPDVLMGLCRMRFKNKKKSRSLSVRKRKIDATTTFTEANQHIPTVSQESVKSLGRWCESSIKDTKRRREAVELATEGLLELAFRVTCVVSTVHTNFRSSSGHSMSMKSAQLKLRQNKLRSISSPGGG